MLADFMPCCTGQVLATACMYIGAFLCAVSIGNLTSLFLSLDRAFTEHQNKVWPRLPLVMVPHQNSTTTHTVAGLRPPLSLYSLVVTLATRWTL